MQLVIEYHFQNLVDPLNLAVKTEFTGNEQL